MKNAIVLALVALSLVGCDAIPQLPPPAPVSHIDGALLTPCDTDVPPPADDSFGAVTDTAGALKGALDKCAQKFGQLIDAVKKAGE